jgi:mono/diheme cytochrome c family protein
LGLDAPQLDRPQDYGGVVDNQLRAWTHLGLFGSGTPAEPQVDVKRLPSPPDVGQSLQDRTLSYFDSNCSHCHHPGGAGATIDFRYFGGPGLSATNICNKLLSGDHTQSLIYQRDAVRGPDAVPGQMPPIATAIPDGRQLPVTAAWIDSLAASNACP